MSEQPKWQPIETAPRASSDEGVIDQCDCASKTVVLDNGDYTFHSCSMCHNRRWDEVRRLQERMQSSRTLQVGGVDYAVQDYEVPKHKVELGDCDYLDNMPLTPYRYAYVVPMNQGGGEC